MPGVPSGRACEACRKQKKKAGRLENPGRTNRHRLTPQQCDETKPICSRCRRLAIPCVGSGERRYKFAAPFEAQYRGASSQSTPDSVVQRNAVSISFSYLPSTQQTLFVAAMVDSVRISLTSDIRRNLTWGFGDYLVEVPKRLGTNAALDAAAMALMKCYSRFLQTGSRATPVEISSYGHALTMLRTCLEDRAVAQSANTLCAVMMLMICQVGETSLT